MAGTALLDGGFTAPVFQSQAAFRLVIDAMAQPGRIVDLGHSVQAPAPLEPAAAAFLATLADYAARLSDHAAAIQQRMPHRHEQDAH
jgi:alpha-D-ribose 1-methylphosphonate 5-triphosphate synthase subunit PhnH